MLCAAPLLAAPAAAQTRDTPKPGDVVTNPDWLRKPTPSQLMAVFPTDAYKRGISGKATISCTITLQGTLTGCVTLDESPAGSGFGAAAIAITPQFLMRPGTINGKPVESSVRIPLNFDLSGGPRDVDSMNSRKVLPSGLAWAEAPSYADVAAVYPKKAREERRGGHVTLSCGMSPQGRLTDCRVAVAEPRNYGFEGAARALAKQFALSINTDADRKATHQLVVHMPITFDPATLDQATPVIGKPTWAHIPGAEEMQTAIARVKLSGTARATLSCSVQPGGTVSGCSVAAEDPPGIGLGAAAMTLAPSFRLTTWTIEGLPVVGGTVRIPLRFEGPAPAATAAK